MSADDDGPNDVVWEGEMWSTARRETVQARILRLARGEHCPHGNLAGCTERCRPALEGHGYRIEKLMTRYDDTGCLKEQFERAEIEEFPAHEWALALVRKIESEVW